MAKKIGPVDGLDYTVACYYFPQWHVDPLNEKWGKGWTEWQVIQNAKPKFAGHLQPKVPQWSYEDESDPRVMAKKINAASEHGIDVFIFDWYYYDNGLLLEAALEKGFLKAKNNEKLLFSLMWCNHNSPHGMDGAVKPETFDRLCDYVIKTYFSHPSYWKIDGCPYFSIYLLSEFVRSYGDVDNAAMAIKRFRDKVRKAGFRDLHINGILWDTLPYDRKRRAEQLGLDSYTSYVWIHHYALPDFPATEYQKVADSYFGFLTKGGGANGLEKPVSQLGIPYHPNVTMGWDSSPRCDQKADWVKNRTYPYGAVIVGNSPEVFKKAVVRAKDYVSNCEQKIITINAWNEWGEGSYLEPDETNGFGYLNALKEVFGGRK
jgi:hypothetical protein